MKVLAIDCATEYCSAALWLQGTVTERSAPPARGLSEHLLQWVEELLAEARIGLRDLDLVAFGRGPGAFTGVRLATSLAHGLGLSAQIPLAPISTLRAVAARALALAPHASHVIVCQDARMHEVYWGRYRREGDDAVLLGAEGLAGPGDVPLDHGAATVAAGSGFDAYPDLLRRWADAARDDATITGMESGTSLSSCAPRAREVALLAVRDGLGRAVPAAHAQAVYLRDNVARPSGP